MGRHRKPRKGQTSDEVDRTTVNLVLLVILKVIDWVRTWLT